MTPLDHVVFFVCLAGLLALGPLLARGQKTGTDFLLAGRSMRWFPIGLSVMVTAFSAINYAAFSGEVFAHGLYVAMALPVFVLVAWPITKIVMPFYHDMKLCSAYDYLERRFDLRVRCMASGLFILWRLFWMATALYVTSKILNSVTGLNLHLLVLLCGVTAIAYTAAGGMRAVMWTDVVQFGILFGGLVLALVVAAAHTPGGMVEIFREGARAGLFKPFHPFDPAMFSFDPRIRITLWSALIGTFTAFLARYGADQVVVQRYFTARSLRDAQRGFHLNYIAAVVSLVCLALLGLAIHAHSAAAGWLEEGRVAPIVYFARFVRDLPAGVCGLIVAGLFAATMSSVDSGIHSCSSAFLIDFHNRLIRRGGKPIQKHGGEPPGLDDEHDDGNNVLRSRILTLLFGTAAMGFTVYIGTLGQSVFEIANRIINGLGSPLLAIITVGMFSRRANAAGVFAGGILGIAWSIYISFGVENLALHYYAVLNLAGTLLAILMCSLIARGFGARSSPEQTAWTWWERRRM